jgi:hypothetical protein
MVTFGARASLPDGSFRTVCIAQARRLDARNRTPASFRARLCCSVLRLRPDANLHQELHKHCPQLCCRQMAQRIANAASGKGCAVQSRVNIVRGFMVLSFLVLACDGGLRASEVPDASGCTRWSALLRQVVVDRNAGVRVSAEQAKLAEIVAEDKARPEPYLFRDADDETYLWFSIIQIYDHPWNTPDQVEQSVLGRCLEQLKKGQVPQIEPCRFIEKLPCLDR